MLNPYSRQLIEDDDIKAVINALRQDILTGGKKVDEFEEAIAKYIGVKYCVVFNSATSALHGAYYCIGLDKGDEIITSPISFVATSNAALYLGAKPLFVDVRFSDGNIDERKIEEKITPHTKAIVPVDYSGNPVNIKTILEIAKRFNLKVIEDAAHAFGSMIGDKKVGSFSDISIFSFHPVKPFTTIEGGALVTNDEKIYKKAKLFRSHGIVKKDKWNMDMTGLGFNYRLSDVACALGLSQLKKIDRFIKTRNEIAQFYDESFKDFELCHPIKRQNNTLSSFHLYPILLDRTLWCAKEDIFDALRQKGLGVQVHYKPIYQNSFYKNLFGEQYFSNAEDFYKAELSILLHHAMDLDDAKNMVKILKNVLSFYQNSCKR
jgi:UDP-4-amino-4,6-dideoxy-L-N-acetyl-beta-L-altrosamine transaminase